MARYDKVQFIAWEVHTGPIRYKRGSLALEKVIPPSDYAGYRLDGDPRLNIHAQCVDIDARVKFTEKAILKALDTVNNDKYNSDNTLKVFMAPEFLYRGAGGAYLHDLLEGWKSSPTYNLPAPYDKAWPGLFGGLKKIVAKKEFENWLFVFGTAISASFKTGVNGVIDVKQPTECYNTAFIQLGGVGNGDISHYTCKHLKSQIDFITSRLDIGRTITPLDLGTSIPLDAIGASEGSAIFTLTKVNHSDDLPIIFGIEICLDHYTNGEDGFSRQPNQPPVYLQNGGRVKCSGQRVDIQLVPSGGMNLIPKCVHLLPAIGGKLRSYAFNCDGLTSNSNEPYDFGTHVQICTQPDGDLMMEKDVVFLGNNVSAHPYHTARISVDNEITLPNVNRSIVDTELWNSSDYPVNKNSNYKINGVYEPPKGAGYVEVFPALELLPTSSLQVAYSSGIADKRMEVDDEDMDDGEMDDDEMDDDEMDDDEMDDDEMDDDEMDE